MPKITIRFEKSFYSSDVSHAAHTFYFDFYKSIGLDINKRFDEQEFEISEKSHIRIFGMDSEIPIFLVESNFWICSLFNNGKMLSFSVGDFMWAAVILKSKDIQYTVDSIPETLTTLSLKDSCIENLPNLCKLKKISHLDLRGCSSLKDILAISDLTALKNLNISWCSPLLSLAPLKDLTNLTKLDWALCKSLVDLSPLAELTKVTDLNLSRCDSLVDLSPLAELTNLTTLDLGSCKSLIDLSPLAKLTKVTDLNLSRCESLVDLSPLAELTNLTTLDLSGCETLIELSPLAVLKKLSSLDLKACESLFDISPLAGLTNLTTLDLSFCESLVDLSPLAAFKKLTHLDLSWRKSLVDLSPLDGLKNLTNLNLSECETLFDLSPLAGLTNLTNLNLGGCKSLADLSPLVGLTNLTSLSFGSLNHRSSSCKSLVDLSPLAKLTKLTSLDFRSCQSLTDLSPLAELDNLISLDLSWCVALADLSALAELTNIKNLDLNSCKSLIDLSPLAELDNLISLDLSWCVALADLSALAGLTNLKNLDLSSCKSLVDLSPLAESTNLTTLDLSQCENLVDLSPLAGLSNLTTLDLSHCERIQSLASLSKIHSLESFIFTSRRVQSIESLRGIPSLREVNEFNPPEVAELLAHNALLRLDCDYIAENSQAWLNEAKGWREAAPSLQDRFAATLGEAFSLLGESPIESAFVDFINNRPDFTAAPWKAWFGGTLKESGFDLYRQRVERVPVSEMLPGAIGGTCETLPYEAQADWSRMWLTALESARLSDAKNLLSVAPEICLALARLGLSKSLHSWLLAFTDPSDPGALDPVHAALAGFQLVKENLPAAENHIFAIESPKLRDPVLAELVTSLSKSDPDGASAKILLIDAPAMRVEQAKRLAAKPGASETTLHRLAVAMADSPSALSELITAIPDPSNKTFLETLSGKLQPARSATFRKIAEGLQREADRLLATAVQN